MDKRFLLLKQYATSIFGNRFSISEVSDDASFRRYFRIVTKENSYIIMDAPPEKENADIFINIAKFLQQGGINTPKIYYKNLELGCVILSDFGNTTLLQKNNLKLYKLAIDEIIKIQALPQQTLPIYDRYLLEKEMLLCSQWFDEQFYYDDIFNFLLDNIKDHKQVVVHRDYHSRNIMVVDNLLGILDFQDSVFGSYVYDLASLLRDAYIELADIEVEVLQKYYFDKAGLDDFDKFIFDFDMIATQRQIKILGIFTRLSTRDGKNNYLRNIPQVQKYLLNISQKYQQLQGLKKLCKQ